MSQSGWIGVDLDGTLAMHNGWKGIDHIGDPVPDMLQRVKLWIENGVEVRIFTARVCDHLGDPDLQAQLRGPIVEWCKRHVGKELPITCTKDFAMIELWDDRCIQVEKNTGKMLGSTNTFPNGKLSEDDEGEIQIGLRHDADLIYLAFGKPIAWLAMPPAQATQISEALAVHAEAVRCGN